jgi:hypothetical protein
MREILGYGEVPADADFLTASSKPDRTVIGSGEMDLRALEEQPQPSKEGRTVIGVGEMTQPSGAQISPVSDNMRKLAEKAISLNMDTTIKMGQNLDDMQRAQTGQEVIKLAEEQIAKGGYDNDTRRVIRQRAAAKAEALMIEGKLPDPDKPESTDWENIKSILPRAKASGGKTVGGTIQNIGELFGSQAITDFGKIIFSGEAANEKRAMPNVPYGGYKEQIGNIGVSSVTQLPLLAANALPYGPFLSLGGFFFLNYGRAYGENREEKMSIGSSMLSAFGESNFEWLSELGPTLTIGKIFKEYAKGSLKGSLKNVANLGYKQGGEFLRRNLVGEEWGGVGQSLQKWAEKYPNKSFSEWLDTVPGEMKDIAIQAFGQTILLSLFGLPLVKVQRAAYTNGVAKDVVQSTNLPMSEVKPIVKQVMRETKDDNSGQTFSIKLQERINKLVETKNAEPIVLSESMKQDITSKLNDTTGPFKAFSIRDVETVIENMRESAPKYADAVQAHLDEYKASMTPDELNQRTIDAEAAKFDTPKSDQERFIPNWDKGASNIIRNKPFADTLVNAWVQHFPGEGTAGEENVLKEPAKVQPMPERTAEQDRTLQPIRQVIHYSSGTRDVVRGATTADETHSYSREVRDRIEAGKEFPEHPYEPVLYTYDAGTPADERERRVTKGVAQQIQVKESDIYDMNADPNKFWTRAGETVKSMGITENHAFRRNIFINLVKEAGFQGYSVGNNEMDGRQTHLFGEHKAVGPESLKVTVSGQVQGTMKPATTLEDATKQGEADLVEIKSAAEEAMKTIFPETTMAGELSSNAYMDQWAKEGEIEPSVMVPLNGPPASTRAFAAWLSLVFDQNAVMVSSENGPTTGQNITFEIAPDMGQEFMEEAIKAGLDDIQINNKKGVLSCDLFVPYEDLEKVEQIINDSLHKYVINAIDHKDANVEFFNRDKEVHQVIVDFFGREKGERIYEQGKQRGTERSRKVQISERAVREIHGREGDQGKAQPEHANEDISPQEAAGKVKVTPYQKLKEWLSGSKSTNIVYHGTDAEEDFKAFKSDKGIWFASNPATAGLYTASHQGGGQRIIPAYIKVSNPLIIPKTLDLSTAHPVGEFLDEINKLNNSNLTAEDLARSSNKLDEKHVGFTMVAMDPLQIMSITNQGFDGIQGFEQGEQVWSVFKPTQIKSIYNQGTSDLEGEDILFRKALSNEPGPHAPGVGLESGNKHGVWEALRVWVTNLVDHPEKKLLLLKTNNDNAEDQLNNVDKILKKFPKAANSLDHWSRMMAYSLSSNDVPIPPYKFIKDINGTGAEEMLQSLSSGQVKATDTGLALTKEIRDAYLNKSLTPETTGKLSMWAFLSRGVSPYFQESLFMDALKSSSPWIQKAIAGDFIKADLPAYYEWVSSIAYKGSGLPSALAASNLNSFGEEFLIRMGQKDEHGVTNLQRLHDKLSDPKQTGKSIRRWFATIGEGIGIDNKIVSFMMLAAGHHDVLILDRIQVGNFWDDGRFSDVNLYDGKKVDGSLVAGSMMKPMFEGARGILIYEALERGVEAKLSKIYGNVGRPNDVSLSRFHWETWDAASGQEVAHDSLRAILADARGDDVTIASVWVKSGKYGEFAYGTQYNRDIQGFPWFLYRTPLGGEYSFSVPAYRMFIDSIKKPGNKVVPSGFRVSNSKTEAWYERKEVDQSRLEELAKKYADRGSKEGKGQPTNKVTTQPVQPAKPKPGGRTPGQVTQGPVPVRAGSGTNEPGEVNLKLTRASDLAKYSFDLKAPKVPIFTIAEVTQMIARPLQRWGDIGNVKVVQSVNELPDKFSSMIKVGDTIFGTYDNKNGADTTYLVADSMMNAKSAITTLVHEVIGHRGVLAVLGPVQARVIMRKVFNAYKDTPVLEKLIRTYELDITKPVHQRVAAHELIAHLAETQEHPTILQRIIGMIRMELRIIIPNLKWTNSDILHLIGRSRAWTSKAGSEIRQSNALSAQPLFRKDGSQPTLERNTLINNQNYPIYNAIMEHPEGRKIINAIQRGEDLAYDPRLAKITQDYNEQSSIRDIEQGQRVETTSEFTTDMLQESLRDELFNYKENQYTPESVAARRQWEASQGNESNRQGFLDEDTGEELMFRKLDKQQRNAYIPVTDEQYKLHNTIRADKPNRVLGTGDLNIDQAISDWKVSDNDTRDFPWWDHVRKDREYARARHLRSIANDPALPDIIPITRNEADTLQNTYILGSRGEATEAVIKLPTRGRLNKDNTPDRWGETGVEGYYVYDQELTEYELPYPMFRKGEPTPPTSASSIDVSSENFKRWFGKSEVVDAKGKPLVVYHGTSGLTTERVKELRESGIEVSTFGTEGIDEFKTPTWFGYPVENFSKWTNEEGGPHTIGQQVIPVYLSIENPYKASQHEIQNKPYDTEWVEEKKKQGYDGMVWKARSDSSEQRLVYVAFSPTQIKSVYNQGTWDLEDPRISFRRGESTSPPTPINPMVAEILARARREAAGTESTTQSIQPPTPTTRANPPGENSRFNLDTSWMKGLFERLQFEAQDRFNYLSKFQKSATEGVTEETDAYNAEVRYHSKVGDKVDSFQEESVKPILDLMHNNNLSTETVDDYLHARHAVEANAQLERINPDLEDNKALSGMTNEQAAEILSQETPALRSIGQMIDRITKSTRTVLVQSGLESQETIDTWESVYKNYVPLYREGTDRQTPGKGKGFDTRGIFKRRTGSTKEVVHILANVISQHESALIRAEKNIVAVSLLKFVQSNRGPWAVNPIKFKPTVNAEGLVVYRQDPSYRLADNVVGVRTNGGETYHIVFDENNEEAVKVAHAMNNWNAGDTGAILGFLMKVNRWLAMVNTSLSPEFVISNFLRDIQTAGINMSDSEADSIRWKAIKDVGSAWKGIRDYHAGRRDAEWAQAYKLFKQSGGKTGWIESYTNIEDREKALVKIINAMRPGVAGSIHRGIRSVFQFIENENTAVENGIRLSVFHNLVQSGVTPNRAGVIAKELTVNFNRKGNSGQALNALYLFYNASIQGSVRMIQAGVKSPKVRIIMGSIIAASMILDITNRLISGDDDDGENRYDKIPGWEKSRNLIVALPSGAGFLKIPLPWGYNVFHVMGQVAGELVSSKRIKTTDGLMRLGGAMVDTFNPIGNVSSLLQTISPTITDPFVQWAENKDWSGRKIRPENNMFGVKKPSSQLYWNSVRAPSKWVAGMLNRITGGDEVKSGMVDISPEMIDLAIDTMTGATGKVVGDALSLPFKVFDPTTKLETHEIPFIRRVYGKPGEQAVSAEFYKNMDAVRMAYERRKHYAGDEAKMTQIRKENRVELDMVNRMRATEPTLIRIRKAEMALEKQPSSADKTARLKELKERKLNIMKAFNKAYINKETQNTTFETQGGEAQ